MEFDELQCPICKEVYNDKDKLPRLLITCGHTFCHNCIQSKLLINNAIMCPEDFTSYENISSVESLPKNISLLKLITRRVLKNFQQERLTNDRDKNKFQSKNHEISPVNKAKAEEEEDSCVKSPKEDTVTVTNFSELLKTMNLNSNEYTSLKQSSENCTTNLRASLRKQSTGTHSNPPLASNKLRSCPSHPNRPLEIICLDHHLKICTNCVLFGEHRNHNIINEEDFMKEIEVKAEILIDLFELIDQNMSCFSSDSLFNEYKTEKLLQKIEKKSAEVTFTIQDFIKEFIRNIKSYEQWILKKVSAKFDAIKQKIQVIAETHNGLREKSTNWQSIVKKKLDTLNEITDPSTDCLKLIETDPQQSHNVLIENAEKIISELVKLKNFPIDLIEKSIDEVGVEINNELVKEITSTSDEVFDEVRGLKASENIESALVLDEDEKKISLNDILQINNSIPAQKKKEHNNMEKIHSTVTRSIPNNGKRTKGNNATTSTNISTLNAIKFPGDSTIRIEKSKSPPRTQTPDKDRIVFIKSQFKCESANFTGYGDEGAQLISEMLLNKALSSKVKELKLTKTNLTDEGALIIFKALEATTCNISSLNIGKNYITDKSTDGIISMLNKNKMLKAVYLTNNSFSASARERIKAYAGTCKSGQTNMKIFI